MPMPEERPVYKRGEVLWGMPEIEAMRDNAVAAERARIADWLLTWADDHFGDSIAEMIFTDLAGRIRSGDLENPRR